MQAMKNLILLLGICFMFNVYSQSYDEILLRKHITEFKEHIRDCNTMPTLSQIDSTGCRCMGIELIKNGSFNNKSSWVLSGSWAIINGHVQITGLGTMTQTLEHELLNDFCYVLKLEIISLINPAGVTVFIESPTLFVGFADQIGVWSFPINLTNRGNKTKLIFTDLGGGVFQIDNVSLIPCCCN